MPPAAILFLASYGMARFCCSAMCSYAQTELLPAHALARWAKNSLCGWLPHCELCTWWAHCQGSARAWRYLARLYTIACSSADGCIPTVSCVPECG